MSTRQEFFDVVAVDRICAIVAPVPADRIGALEVSSGDRAASVMIQIGTMMRRFRAKAIELRKVPIAPCRLAVRARELRKGDFLPDDQLLGVAQEERAMFLEDRAEPDDVERFVTQGWPPVRGQPPDCRVVLRRALSEHRRRAAAATTR